MKFEVLKRSHMKRNVIVGVLVILIISACILTFTRAKYRVTESVQIATGQINYSGYDFKIIAMYQENDSGTYSEIEAMPSSGYAINETESYCTIDGTNRDPDARLYTDSQGQHVFAGLKKNSKCYLYFDKAVLIAANAILSGRTPLIRTFPTTASTTVEGTNWQGDIYQAKDDDGITYYFAGNPDDNWLYFYGHYWRIIRINGDGTIRMIYSGTGNAEVTGIGTQITVDESNISEFNTDYNASYYVGLKYSSSQHGTATESKILERLNTWYVNNIQEIYRSYIDIDAGFCGDREMASGYSWTVNPGRTIYYVAYDRLWRNTDNVEPSFKCIDSRDLYTVSSSNRGNHSLANPIGLITADEVVYAGLPAIGSTTDNYLYTSQEYWTISPYRYNGNTTALVFTVSSVGDLGGLLVYDAYGVRPVINLRADVQLTGDGTASNPYQIVETA